MVELIYSVQYIFQEYLKKRGCIFFNIPEYQRGYKWTSDNVITLLDDLKNFKKSSDDDFYCLQNITLTQSILKGSQCINVIDGQQRLTTLFIILSFIQRDYANKVIDKNAHILRYSIRNQTDEFLRSKIQSGIIWDKTIDPTEANFRDQYYIMEVAKAVKEWFDKNADCQIDNTILKDLKLIINEVESGEDETVFASLNGGKVDLDGADLMRAILITRAAKQKYPETIIPIEIPKIIRDDLDINVGINVSSRGKINEYRVKLGIELDKMNLWWSDEDVKEYFKQLLPNRISHNKDFKFADYPIDLLYYAFFEANKSGVFNEYKGKDLDIRYFENGIDLNKKPGDDHLEFYNELKEFHLTLVDWYNNDEIYNLVGYLMYNFKGTLSFELIWNVWKSCTTKGEFKKKIKRLIRYQLAINSENDIDDNQDSRINTIKRIINGERIDEIEEKLRSLRLKILDTSKEDWYSNPFTIKLLPIFDILPFTMIDGKKPKTVIKRLKQSYLKRTSSEDKEHIRSQKRNIDKENMSEDDIEYLQEENRHGLNSIGNIVLLHESINKSYHNAPLLMKMVRIYSEHIQDDVNAYIRPHTFSVFMSKLQDMENNGKSETELFWSDNDIKKTVGLMDKRLTDYFKLPSIVTD